MALISTTGHCLVCDTRAGFSRPDLDENNPLLCRKCGAEYGSAALRESGRRHGVLNDNEVANIPQEHLLRDERHNPGKSGSQVEKDYAEAIMVKRAMNEGKKKEEGHLAMSVPPEYYHAKRKVDRHYWLDKKNVERERRVWGVD